MLTNIDWIVVLVFLLLTVVSGLLYTKSSGKNLESFFLGGRNLPWWLAGLSMVATTFAADTPLAVTEIVSKTGISGNWLWWNFLAGGMLTTFFFAKLWQRSAVLTEAEFIELRYSGKEASFLRGFKAIYLGLFMNIMIVGWVNLAMMTLLQVLFGYDFYMSALITGALMVLVAIYASLSGLMGVAVTDAIQFVIAMVGCIVLAYFVVQSEEIGGLAGLKDKVSQIDPAALDFLPKVGRQEGVQASLTLSWITFLSYTTLLWWASWYPGAEPGGGGYIAQRMMSTKSEKDAFKATLFFQIAHYCLRPWPWIIVGLACIVLYAIPPHMESDDLKRDMIQLKKTYQLNDAFFIGSPDEVQTRIENKDLHKESNKIESIRSFLMQEKNENKKLSTAIDYAQDPRKGYVFAMKDYLPQGLLGLLLVAFFAAYMSTISTQLNWGAGYLVNDVYKRFLKPEAKDEHYILISRLITLLMAILGAVVSLFITKISGAWSFIMQCGAGLGLVLILRWYWWRINAWSEIVAMIFPVLLTFLFYFYAPESEWAFPITVLGTSLAWILVTFLTRPVDEKVMASFFERVKPEGIWPGISAEQRLKKLVPLFASWLLAIGMAYSILFAIGNLLLLRWELALIQGVLAILCILGLKKFM